MTSSAFESHKILVLAPMLGITTSAYRYVFFKHFIGFNEALAPFILAGQKQICFDKLTKDLCPKYIGEALPVIPQIIGNSGIEFAELATYLQETKGYHHINWNIGCAAGTTPSRLRGAALLQHPDLVDRFLNDAFRHFNGQISIKMRLGMKEAEECMKLVEILNRYPIRYIYMHPRIGDQHFSGNVDLQGFGKFAGQMKHPMIFNGDIWTANDIIQLQKLFPFLTGFMLGRGSITNPWLPQEILENKSPSSLFSPITFKKFHDELFHIYQDSMQGGPGPVLGRMRELWPYWQPHFRKQDRIIRNIIKSKSFAEYASAVDTAFDALVS